MAEFESLVRFSTDIMILEDLKVGRMSFPQLMVEQWNKLESRTFF